ncbi:hypothetical protein [Acinetobacter proteolyticus]|uniref:hypothetical protein n=1 Tax=Acinetobacter proteolyticus TaxID=1776741 RepID=UPI003D994159
MNNYKIKVNGTHPLEYQDILDVASELDYDNEDWGNLYNVNYLFLNDDGSVGFSLNGEAVSDEHQELTLPQLRDIVVLHRNDVKDANFKLFISPSQGYLSLYKASDDLFYVYAEKAKCWDKSRSVSIKTKDLEPIHTSKEDEQGLISGADALRALADGKEVEYFDKLNKEWDADTSILPISVFTNGSVNFRLKPRTIKRSLEIPAPFEPKVGEKYFYLAHTNTGYDSDVYESTNIDECQTQFGAWDSEEKVKQAVAALRGIKG